MCLIPTITMTNHSVISSHRTILSGSKKCEEALGKQIPKKPLIWQGIKTPESPIPFDDWGI